MGKVLQFPVKGKIVKNPLARTRALEKRFGELENRCLSLKEDMEYMAQCMNEDTEEMGNILRELAELGGYLEPET